LAIKFTAPDSNDPEAGKRAEEADRVEHWDSEALNAFMGTPQGRYLMERFLDYSCEGRDLYLNDGDALGMAMRDGLARAGRWWRIKLEQHCPDRFLQMVRERRGRIARAQAAMKAKEATAQPESEPSGITPIEEMADEQQRIAAEEAAAAARKKTSPKKEK
jgi:hypothetical protein